MFTSKNLWLADLISASVLSKSIVTYPFAFVPVHHLSDSYFQNVNDFEHNIVRRIPIAEGLARSVLYVGDVSFDPGAAAGKGKVRKNVKS